MRSRNLAIGIVMIVTLSVAMARSVSAQGTGPLGGPPLVTQNPALRESLERLSSGSAAWRDALELLILTGRLAVLVTPDRVRVRDERKVTDAPFDPEVLAEVQPLADEHSRVDTVVVIVNVPLLERMHESSLRVEFEDDLDRILAHEVYGHAVPYLLAGSLSGKCADPARGQRATEACAIKRENIIRGELRLGQRREYGLDGLAMARRFRQ